MSPLQTSQLTFIPDHDSRGRKGANSPWLMLRASGIPAGSEHLPGLLSSSMECRNILSLLLTIQKVTFLSRGPSVPQWVFSPEGHAVTLCPSPSPWVLLAQH